MEDESSLPHLQEATTVPCTESDASNPISLRSILILSYHLRLGFGVVSSIQVFQLKCFMHLSPNHVRATCPTHPIFFDLLALIFGKRLQFMKLLIMQFSPVSRDFLPLRSKYSPQHPVRTP